MFLIKLHALEISKVNDGEVSFFLRAFLRLVSDTDFCCVEQECCELDELTGACAEVAGEANTPSARVPLNTPASGFPLTRWDLCLSSKRNKNPDLETASRWFRRNTEAEILRTWPKTLLRSKFINAAALPGVCSRGLQVPTLYNCFDRTHFHAVHSTTTTPEVVNCSHNEVRPRPLSIIAHKRLL